MKASSLAGEKRSVKRGGWAERERISSADGILFEIATRGIGALLRPDPVAGCDRSLVRTRTQNLDIAHAASITGRTPILIRNTRVALELLTGNYTSGVLFLAGFLQTVPGAGN